MELRVCGNVRLDEERGSFGVEPDGEKIERELPDVAAELRRVGVVRGERVPVDDAIEAFELVLHRHPVVESSYQVAQVGGSRRPHAGENSLFPHLVRVGC